MQKFIFGAALLGVALFSSVSHAAPDSPASASIGFQGIKPRLDQVAVTSPHVLDYTFAAAPTDWRVQSGVWEMTNRWSCAPGWSWFGGRSNETAAIWNKRKFSGDISVQFYIGFKMENSGTFDPVTKEYRWWEYPADVAVTIGGDGQNLSSGYTFIVGANDNQRTVLLRGDKVVEESTAREHVLASYEDGTDDMDNRVHRRWWYMRIDKVGSRVSCYLDNRRVFSYLDPKPLDAGQIALWTYKNGIMLSRVQIYYQNEAQRPFSLANRLAKQAAKRHTSSASAPATQSPPARRAALQR